MIENDILQLSSQQTPSLERLEADIWAGVDTRLEALRVSKAVLSWQTAVLTIALLGSVVAGTQTGIAARQGSDVAALSMRANLAPSTLLVGH